MPSKHFADGRDQIASQMPLGDVAAGTGGKCGRNVLALFVNRQEYDLGSAISVSQMFCGLYSIHNWHRHVDHQYVRVQAANSVNSIFSVLCCADDLKLRVQIHAKLSEDVIVIISEHHSNSSHKGPLVAG
jgi:hypothetical protein